MNKYDFVIVGGGIVGLTIARALSKHRLGSVLILEKEAELGRHASGKNSGVLHAGIYYGTDSLKAKVCVEGSRLMREYAQEHGIPVLKTGKVIVATEPSAVSTIDQLYRRAITNGARVEKISPQKLQQIEPEAHTCEIALFSPDTAVIDPHHVLSALETEIKSLGIELKKNVPVCEIDETKQIAKTKNDCFEYGHLINAAGLHADRIAHWMGVGKQYRILPFKGIYRKLTPNAALRIRGSIYPTLDIRMPFLGVHLTRTIHGEVIVGPTAIPAFGRENYHFFDDLNFKDSSAIIKDLLIMIGRNQDGIRNLVKEEVTKYIGSGLLRRVQKLAPSIQKEEILPEEAAVGIRAQLIDQSTMKLVMDFVLEEGPSSTHILNAISPAFTGSLAFAELVISKIRRRELISS